MKVFLSFLLVCISIPILAQRQPIGCPLDQAILNAPAIGASKVGAEDLKSFILNQLKLMPPYVNRSFKPSSSNRFFSVKKEPGDLTIYDINFNPADAYLALHGQGASRVLPLYLLLHAIVHTDLKHSEASRTQETAADEKVGAYLAQLGIRWPDIEIILSRHIKDEATRKAVILRGYQTVNPPPIARFTTSSDQEYIAPCRVDFDARNSQNVVPGAKYFWNGTELTSTVYATYQNPGKYSMKLRVINPDGQEHTTEPEVLINVKENEPPHEPINPPIPVTTPALKIEPVPENEKGQTGSEAKEIKVSNPKKGIVGLWEINAFAALPLGNYGSSLIYDANINRWNPNAGMALLGGGIEATLGIKVKWLGLGMHLGAMYSPYNTLALDDNLGDYQDNRKELLQNRSFTSTGHRFATAAGYLSLEPTQGGRFYLAFEPAYGLLLLPFQNEVSVTYQKEDGKLNTTRIFYGDQGNSTAYFAGKLSLGIRTGSLQRKNQKEESLIYISGTYMHADLKIATQSHSFGDNSTPLTISQLPIRCANLGIGYRHTF